MRGLIPEKNRNPKDLCFNVVTRRHFDEEEILQAIATAEDEMLRNGIEAVGDICNNDLTTLQKSKQRLQYYNFRSQLAPPKYPIPNEPLLGGYNTFCQLSTPNPQAPVDCHLTSIVPHAPYSVSENLWQLLQPFIKVKQ